MMEGIRSRVSSLCGLDLLADTKFDGQRMFQGRLFLRSPHFNFEYSLLRVKQRASAPGPSYYEVQLRTEMLPRVNDFSKYFPRTRSNTLVRNIAEAAKEEIAKFEGREVSVVVERDIATNAAYIVAAEGGAGAAIGGLLGFLLTLSTSGTLYGGILGGLLGVGLTLLLIFRMFD